VALPAVVLVLGTAVWGVQLAAVQVRLEAAAGAAARAAARGADAARVVADAHPTAVLHVQHSDGLVCAQVEARASGPVGLPPVALAARSCAVPESW